MEVINERLESIAIFSRSDNDASVGIIVKNLIAIKDIRTVLVQLRKGIGDGMNKASIRSGIWSVLRLVGLCWCIRKLGLRYDSSHSIHYESETP